MKIKGFFGSKLNWLGILTVLIGLAEVADQVPEPYGKWALAISGCATIVLRTFFTATRVQIGGEK